MRPTAVLALCAAALSGGPVAAGTAAAPMVVQVRFVPAQATASCRAIDASSAVACDIRMANVPAPVNAGPLGSAATADQATGDVYWKADADPVRGDGGFYSAFTTSRLVTYGGREFLEMTLSW